MLNRCRSRRCWRTSSRAKARGRRQSALLPPKPIRSPSLTSAPASASVARLSLLPLPESAVFSSGVNCWQYLDQPTGWMVSRQRSFELGADDLWNRPRDPLLSVEIDVGDA